MTTRWLSTRLHISPRWISPRFKLARFKRQLDFARAPRQLCFPSTPGITDDLLSILSKLLSWLSHISRQTTHDVTDFRHSIDWEIDLFSNQLLISRHKAWICWFFRGCNCIQIHITHQRQLARSYGFRVFLHWSSFTPLQKPCFSHNLNVKMLITRHRTIFSIRVSHS